MYDRSYLAYKYTTLATGQRDVVVVRTALTAAMVVPSTMFKADDPTNSETRVSKYDLIRKLVFTIIATAREVSLSLNLSRISSDDRA